MICHINKTLVMAVAALLLLPSCHGILSGVYDDPPEENPDGVYTRSGELYLDASSWSEWHYIDLPSLARNVAKDSLFNTSSLWQTLPIPVEKISSHQAPEAPGIYTYWYDVYGEGLSKSEFRSFTPTAPQPEPADWSFALHRQNVRTNGGAMALTDITDIDRIPTERSWFDSLPFAPDEWTEKDVWAVQDRMLSGIIGSQGIRINRTGSRWLRIDIPPMPPAFTMDGHVFILRLQDGAFAALQLRNYMDARGKKCVLSINYRYPLEIR